MKQILQKTFNQLPLSYNESYETLLKMGKGEISEIEMTAFISAFNMKEISVNELKGFRDALLDLSVRVAFSANDSIDMCGTGGDEKNTINVSTISSFVVAGAGYRVVKHGNYGVSSLCGSSNVLEYLGYQFSSNSSFLEQQLDSTGICFLHAPLFHPAMRHVATIRKVLGIKTFFNLLGPLVNPAQPSHQLVGVFNLKIARKFKYLLEESKRQFLVVHNTDGYDEATLTAPLKLLGNQIDTEIFPGELNAAQVLPKDLHGGSSIKEAASLFTRILSGNGTKSQTDVIAANAGLAIHCMNTNLSLSDCIMEARKSIESKAALTTLQNALS